MDIKHHFANIYQDTRKLCKEFYEDFKQSSVEVFNRNGKLLTIGAVAMILFVGTALVRAPEQAGIAAIVVIAYFIVIFAFFNARVLIKVAVSVVVILFTVTVAFQMGILIGQSQGDGLLWFTELMFFYFAILSISYWKIQARSRWGVLTFTLLVNFIVSYSVALMWMNVIYAAIAGFAAGLALYIYLTFVSRKSTFKASEMPLNIMVEDLTSNAIEVADESNWSVRTQHNEDKNTGHFLAWKDRAYLMLPVHMTQAFTAKTRRRKRPGIAYHDNFINPWIVEQIFSHIPFWKVRGANVMLVLLDLKNANGKNAKVIGVALPDTQRQIPVGIVPAKALLSEQPSPKFLDTLDSAFNEYASNLTEKQKEALLQYGLSRMEKKAVLEEITSEDFDTLEEAQNAHEDTNQGTKKTK